MLISTVQQNDSVTHTDLLLHMIFCCTLLQELEYSSQNCPVGPYCLCILDVIFDSIHLLIPDSQPFLSPPPPLGNHSLEPFYTEGKALQFRA